MFVSYLTPAENAWERTRRLLFRPVDIESWAVLGFTAFLAYLVSHSSGASIAFNGRPRLHMDWPWLVVGFTLLLFGAVIGTVLLWLSSRCQPIFLDNVMHERAQLVEPWGRLGAVGNSLFVWRLCYFVALLLVVGLIAIPAAGVGQMLDHAAWSGPTSLLFEFATLSLLLILGLTAAYIGLFLESFVVPLMWRRGCTATEGWREFLPLLRGHLPEFLAYGFVVFCGAVALMLALMAAAVATCCILPLLLSVPYLSSVLLLPISVFFRNYSVEFLAQFSPEFDVRPTAVIVQPEAPVESPVEPTVEPTGSDSAPPEQHDSDPADPDPDPSDSTPRDR